MKGLIELIIKCRDEVVKNIEQAIKIADNAITHLESICRNAPNEFSIQQKREYTNKLYDNIEAFDRFKQNATILLNESKTLPQTDISIISKPMEYLYVSSKRWQNF